MIYFNKSADMSFICELAHVSGSSPRHNWSGAMKRKAEESADREVFEDRIIRLSGRVTVRQLLSYAGAAVMDTNAILDSIDSTAPDGDMDETACGLAAFVAEHFLFGHRRCILLALESEAGSLDKHPVFTRGQHLDLFRTIGAKLSCAFGDRDWHGIALEQFLTAERNASDTDDAGVLAELDAISRCYGTKGKPHLRVPVVMFLLYVGVKMEVVDVMLASLRRQLENLKTGSGGMADAFESPGTAVERCDYSLLLSVHPENEMRPWLAEALERCYVRACNSVGGH